MSLQEWAEFGWLHAEPTSVDEMRGLFSIMERDIKDANVPGLSDDRRFEAAYNAARTAANIALRASGFRTSTQAGHHLKTLESLEFTIHASETFIRRLKALSKKRNATSYDTAGNISGEELDLALRTAAELRQTVSSWLKEQHPDLVPA